MQLFGDDADPNAWISLIVEHAGRCGHTEVSLREFQALVSAHWHRGAFLLEQDWEETQGDLRAFVVRMAELANLPEEGTSSTADGSTVGRTGGDGAALAAEIRLPVGPVAEDVRLGEPVVFPLNAPGGSPHMAIMGGTNSGKTYTAKTMLTQLRTYGSFPFLAFDFKGDLSETFAQDMEAKVVSPPRQAVPLHVLHVVRDDEVGIAEAAGRIRESIGRVNNAKLGGVQADVLREAILQVLRAQTAERSAEIEDIARALASEYSARDRKDDGLIATLNELTQFPLFTPDMEPDEFFRGRWIVKLPSDAPADMRRLIVNLILDSLDRWINSGPDAPIIDNRQSVRHICLLDEAHVILRTRLPALSNLIRMSRSKGGVLMLVSQSPDDFEGDDEDFLDNMGLTVAFRTQAKPGPTRRIFGRGPPLTDMAAGEALCRIQVETKTRHIVAWRP